MNPPTKTEYPQIGSLEWCQRMAQAERELRSAQREIAAHCMALQEGIKKIFQEFA